MNVFGYSKLALSNLWRTKSRSALTMLGMIIGVTSVIMMISIGKATERFILSQVASFGSDLLIIGNGKGDGTGGGGPDPTVKKTLTLDDVERLERKSWVTDIDANFFTKDLVTYGGSSGFVDIVGMKADALDISSFNLETGRFVSDDDVELHSRVAVIGNQIAKDYFGQENPLGKGIKINGQTYRVIGVLQAGGTRFFQSIDRQVYVPVSTVMRDYGQKYITIIFLKSSIEDLEETKNLIRIELRAEHRIDNPLGILAKDDFIVRTQEDAQERAGAIGLILQILLGAVAAISLVVGGVGIMNIMYVTVKERTREIGLRKALGARRVDLLTQFLVECVILTVSGGSIGVILGVVGSYAGLTILSSYQDGWSFAMPWNAMILGFGVSVFIGIIFGYLPARRAARLQAIEALRYE